MSSDESKSEFVEKIERRADPTRWHAHAVLNKFSELGDSDAIKEAGADLTVEQAALHVIALCAKDTYRLNRQKISSFDKGDALADNEVTIAGISMGRHDIGLSIGHPRGTDEDDRKPLRFKNKAGCVITFPNRGGEPEYNKEAWEKARIAFLDECLRKQANIICFGEFDFPPQQNGDDGASFISKVRGRINQCDFPVFVLAGTRHEYHEKTNSCHNVARIIVNGNINTAPHEDEHKDVYHHKKVVPATKVGEILTAPKEINAYYYDTKLGKIAVLICVDAYNPTLMLSLFDPKLRPSKEAAKDESDRLDFIIVPSYNFSPKLYYSCQVLSLICRCTVLLVDACNHWIGTKNDLRRRQVELFFNGRAVNDRLNSKEPNEIGSLETDGENLKVWRLKRNVLRAESAQTEIASPTPTFDALGSYLGDL